MAVSWRKILEKDVSLVVIQVNGKNTISIKENLDEKELIDLIKNKELITKYLNDGELVEDNIY